MFLSRKPKGQVLWFTGLSGSGKSLITKAVETRLKERGQHVQCLDGDVIRAVFPQTGFTRKDRDEHVRRVGYIASLLEQHGIIVLCSLISPYRTARIDVSEMCTRYKEVYVECPLAVCEARDVKGLYKKARAGEIANFTGISDPYQPPLCADLVLPTHLRTLHQCVTDVLTLIRKG